MREVKWVDKSLRLNDGVELVSRIWKPKDKGSWPALLMRQPYGREIASTITYSHPEWWASKGYIVVIQDVRGQGSSGGIFKGFSQEPRDTSETHEWEARLPEIQHPNCRGSGRFCEHEGGGVPSLQAAP